MKESVKLRGNLSVKDLILKLETVFGYIWEVFEIWKEKTTKFFTFENV